MEDLNQPRLKLLVSRKPFLYNLIFSLLNELQNKRLLKDMHKDIKYTACLKICRELYHCVEHDPKIDPYQKEIIHNYNAYLYLDELYDAILSSKELQHQWINKNGLREIICYLCDLS